MRIVCGVKLLHTAFKRNHPLALLTSSFTWKGNSFVENLLNTLTYHQNISVSVHVNIIYNRILNDDVDFVQWIKQYFQLLRFRFLTICPRNTFTYFLSMIWRYQIVPVCYYTYYDYHKIRMMSCPIQEKADHLNILSLEKGLYIIY